MDPNALGLQIAQSRSYLYTLRPKTPCLKLAEDVMLDESRQLLGLGSRSPNPQECKAVLAFYSSAIDCLVCAAHPKGGEQKGGSVTHAATDIPCRRLHAAQFVEQTSHRGECQMKKSKGFCFFAEFGLLGAQFKSCASRGCRRCEFGW